MTDEPTSKKSSTESKRGSGRDAQRTVFVVSPIGKSGTADFERGRLVLNYIVKKAFPAPAWQVIRADEEESPDSITTQVIDRIVKSDLIVADLTGHNPNVFYELAVAHGYARPVIHIITEGESMPFDIVDQRAIFYDLTNPASVDDAIKKMANSQMWLDDNPAPRTPLSAHGLFTAISSTPPGSESNEAIAEALSSIVLRLTKIERNTVSRGGPRGGTLEDGRSRLLSPFEEVTADTSVGSIIRMLRRVDALLDGTSEGGSGFKGTPGEMTRLMDQKAHLLRELELRR